MFFTKIGKLFYLSHFVRVMSSYRKSFDLFCLLALSLLLILLLSRTFRHVTHIIIILSQKKSVAEGYDTVGVGPGAEGYDLIKKFYIRDTVNTFLCYFITIIIIPNNNILPTILNNGIESIR